MSIIAIIPIIITTTTTTTIITITKDWRHEDSMELLASRCAPAMYFSSTTPHTKPLLRSMTYLGLYGALNPKP